MARKASLDIDKVSPFAKWLLAAIKGRGVTMVRVAEEAEMNVSQLHKIIKSYLPQYSSYSRPGYEKTVKIGEFFGDVKGALEAAGYQSDSADEIVPRLPPDAMWIAEQYLGANGATQKAFRALAETVTIHNPDGTTLDMSREDAYLASEHGETTIGKRAT